MSRRAVAPLGARLVRSPRVLFGGLVCLLLVAAALLAPWLAPMDPLEQDLLSPFEPPAWSGAAAPPSPDDAPRHWLGTDNLGRDVLSRLIYGARTALIVAVTAALLAALAGSTLGALAGYAGGRADTVIGRLVDVWMSFPPVLLAIVLVSVIGTGLVSVIVAIAIVDWTRFCRVVRAETRAQRALDYVTSARMLGLSAPRILLTEVLPNVTPLLITLLTLEMGIAIVVEAMLSFVGLSVASGASTWGGMLGEGRLYVNQAPWLMVLPMAAMMLAVLGLNALGDGLRRELDPVVRR
ncbi:MAG: ABC transporter permease [Burkholderiales bacterium]|nr:ABC transporter permease [Burkholderiales bacterium]OJX08299.1 MAG: ABC transporter permease [Burkholderiales bacterium 70-64]